MAAALPSGTVTFLFTDIEGSTQLLHRLSEVYTSVLTDHHRLLRRAWVEHGGVEVDTAGDGFFVAFPTAPAAVAAAATATCSVAEHSWPEGSTLQVRMGLHTGSPQLVGDRYVGLDVHRAARIAAPLAPVASVGSHHRRCTPTVRRHTFARIQAGTLVQHPTYGRCTVGGYDRTTQRASLHAYKTNKRLTQSAKPGDCRRLTTIAFRCWLVPVQSVKQATKKKGAALPPHS